MDDTHIYEGATEAEHQAYIKKMVRQAINYWLVVKLSAYKFHLYETIFTGHIVNGRQVPMHQMKLKTISKWPVPRHKATVLAFLGFANCYHPFLHNLSAKKHAFIYVTQHAQFTDVNCQQQAVNELQTRSLSTASLPKLARTLETIMEPDVCNQDIAGIMCQYYIVAGAQLLHPVT